MHTPPVSPGGFPFQLDRRFVLNAMATLGLAIGSCGPALADPLHQFVGNVNAFATGSNTDSQGGMNRPGTWTLGDKDFTYLASSNWTGIESIALQVNVDPGVRSHEFLISNLSGYTTTSAMPLGIDYRVHINGADGPVHFTSVRLGVIIADPTVDVSKDIFLSEADYMGNVNAIHLTSLNGTPASSTIAGVLTDLWIRDTILLTGEGKVSSVNNVFRQSVVPEIDPASFGSSFAVVLGALSLLERRARRVLGMAMAA